MQNYICIYKLLCLCSSEISISITHNFVVPLEYVQSSWLPICHSPQHCEAKLQLYTTYTHYASCMRSPAAALSAIPGHKQQPYNRVRADASRIYTAQPRSTRPALCYLSSIRRRRRRSTTIQNRAPAKATEHESGGFWTAHVYSAHI